MTGLPPGTTGRGPYQNYTSAQRMTTIALALEVGVTQAATTTDTPSTTIYAWLKDAGGLAELRRISSETVLHAQQRATAAVHEQLRLRAEAGEMTTDQLLQAHLGQVQAAATVAKAQASGRTDGAGAQAGAQAVIFVKIENKDGTTEMIEVPRDRPALAQPADSAPDPNTEPAA